MAGGYDCGIWGWADGQGSLIPLLAACSNVIVGTNPPYSVTDFLTLYPKFGGTPKTLAGVLNGTTAVTGLSSTAGLLVGQYVTGQGIPSGATIADIVSGMAITLSLPATISASGVLLTIYVAPLVPGAVLNAYIYLASNSIFQARWNEMWFIAMGLFIAHYCTLWLQGEAATPNATAAQAAASGLALGIKTSKSAGDVSVGIEAVLIEGMGSWNLTLYGQELATWALTIGSGNMLFL